VQLDRARPKPGSTSSGQGFRLRDFRQSKDATIEGSGCGLATCRHGELNVIDGEDREGIRAH
jgi:hypothetical protein